MPEASGFESLAEVRGPSRKSSNMSTSSDDSLRKISNDSGISVASAQALPSATRAQLDQLMGDQRLPNDLSAAVLLAQQQSLSAAAALNPAMFSLMSAGLGGLWNNPLAAAAILQQEAQANGRKMMEASNGSGVAGKLYSKEAFPAYPGIGGLMQSNCSSQVAEQLALSEALQRQLLSRKLSEEAVVMGHTVKPTRKANSFSGSCSSPMISQRPSPPTNNSVSPTTSSHNHHLSPNMNMVPSHSGDENQHSPYGDEDSTSSTKSSTRSRTPPPQASQPHMTQSLGYADTLSLSNRQHVQPAGRKRKNGIFGSLPMAADLSAYAVSSHPQFPLHNADNIPMHKLSTASLPASLPSSARPSIVQDLPLGRGSPATSRKRHRNQPEDKVGYREDESYWERRRKNNEAAKRSRDSRRAKEDEIAIRAAFLEQENLRLRVDLNKMKEEFSRLQTELDTFKKPDNGKPSDENHTTAEVKGGDNSKGAGDSHDGDTTQPVPQEKSTSQAPAITNGHSS